MFVRLLDLVDLRNSSVKSDPFECWLLAVHCMAFFNQSDGLQHIGNIIESPNFSFQFLFFLVFNLVWLLEFRNLLSSLLKANHVLPSDEEMDEMLAKDTETFLFLVLLLLAAVLFRELFLFLV